MKKAQNLMVFIRFIYILLIMLFTSCSTEGAIQAILGMSVQAPVFIECKSLSSTELLFSFSHSVRLVSAYFDPYQEYEVLEEGMEIRLAFAEPVQEGRRITVDLLVEDADRNTLNVIIPFRTRNDRMPLIVFNELRLDYSNPRIEFIEFYVLEPGNLGAMRLFIAHQSMTTPFYEFAPVEVKRGDYIVLHMRTQNENSVDELGEDINISQGDGANDNARDFWVSGNRRLLHSPNGLWLLDQDDNIIDSLLLSLNPEADINNRTFLAAAEFLVSKGEWSMDPHNAIITRGTAATRTLNRDESLPHERKAGAWYITVQSGHTPGFLNDTRRYVN